MEIQELYHRYSRDIYRFAYWLSGNAADADDITAETFVRAWTSSRPVRTATAKAYLLRIARNLFLESRRSSRTTTELSEQLVDPRPGPERTVSSARDVEELRLHLAELSEVDRSALLLRVDESLPYDEIARILSISLSAAKVKVHRARLRLAERLSTGRPHASMKKPEPTEKKESETKRVQSP